MPTGDQKRQPPAHAGRLPPWERLAIAAVLLAMAGLVVVIMLSTGPSQRSAGPAVTPRHPRGSAGTSTGPIASADPAGLLPASAAWEDQNLAGALAPALRGRPGTLAVGVINGRAGAVYDGTRVFHAASIERADILAALLLQHQRAGTAMSEQQRDLAEKMIENSDDAAAGALWNAVGRARGVAAANHVLHLDHTTPGNAWQLTGTTVDDQLWLLSDLTSPGSPLSAASRSYELGLMRHVAAGRRWGVTAAATPGSSPAVADGSLPGPSRAGITWVIDSIGVLYQAGHQVLIAILSDGQPTEYAGIDQVGAAAAAAVSAVTGGRGARPARGSGGM
jgi:hypothetical protein